MNSAAALAGIVIHNQDGGVPVVLVVSDAMPQAIPFEGEFQMLPCTWE
jgi:hypothetical protein